MKNDSLHSYNNNIIFLYYMNRNLTKTPRMKSQLVDKILLYLKPTLFEYKIKR